MFDCNDDYLNRILSYGNIITFVHDGVIKGKAKVYNNCLLGFAIDKKYQNNGLGALFIKDIKIQYPNKLKLVCTNKYAIKLYLKNGATQVSEYEFII